jgi:hypothetical protein
MSFPPTSDEMNPNPFWSLNHLTLPVAIQPLLSRPEMRRRESVKEPSGTIRKELQRAFPASKALPGAGGALRAGKTIPRTPNHSKNRQCFPHPPAELSTNDNSDAQFSPGITVFFEHCARFTPLNRVSFNIDGFETTANCSE